MTTLSQIAKQVTVCDEVTVRKLYTVITLRLKDIHREIRKHNAEFDKFLIRRNPVSTNITIAVTEINCLQRLPVGCERIKQHAAELSRRLVEFKEDIGTPLCKTAPHAYEFFANNVVEPFLKLVRKDIVLPDITLLLTQLYTELIQDSGKRRS